MNGKEMLIVLLLVFFTSITICQDICAQDRLYSNTFPLRDVVLMDGPFKHARDLNIQVLLKYDVNRLLAPYRKEAGLPAKEKYLTAAKRYSHRQLLDPLSEGIDNLDNKHANTNGQNPIIFADVPDPSMIRVKDTYYMSSTTMHMSPGVPIMKSKDLVNWKLVNYAYDTLANVDELNLTNGKSTYGRGSWASCIRYHNGT